MRFWTCSMMQHMRGRRVKDGVTFDGASSEVWKKTKQQTLWKKFKKTLTQCFT